MAPPLETRVRADSRERTMPKLHWGCNLNTRRDLAGKVLSMRRGDATLGGPLATVA